MSHLAHALALTPEEKARWTADGSIGFAEPMPQAEVIKRAKLSRNQGKIKGPLLVFLEQLEPSDPGWSLFPTESPSRARDIISALQGSQGRTYATRKHHLGLQIRRIA